MGQSCFTLQQSNIVLNILDMESDQVSRLLELAAAISSAQEKVTGNGKLDMAGIMAALSLAHQEELSIKESSQAGGQNSFLHGKYQVDSKSSLVRAEYVKETTLSEESEAWETVEGEEKTKSFLYDKKTVKSVERSENLRDTLERGKSKGNVMMNTKPSETNGGKRIEGGLATLVENERKIKGNVNESFLYNNGRKVDLLLKDNKSDLFGRKVAGHKAAFENLNSSSSASSPFSSSSNANSPPSFKKHELPAKTDNNAGRKNESSVPNLASSQNIANFLTKHQSWKKTGSEKKVTNTSSNIGNMKEEIREDKEKITGIADKKFLFERSVSKDNLEDKKSTHSVKIENMVNSKLMSTNNHEDLRPNGEMNLPDLLDSSDAEVSKFLATVSRLAAEKEKKTGNGKLDMAELAGALSSINNERTVPCVAEQNKKQIPFHEKKLLKVESELSQSQTTTSSSSMRSECDTKKTSSSSTPSSLANAKTSFLQSIITSPGASNGLERNNSEAFMQEKNSVITQQKNIINDDPTPPPVTNMAKRSFNAVPKGFQAPDLTATADSNKVSSSDQLVKKMVYNQYREMLKSYTSSN